MGLLQREKAVVVPGGLPEHGEGKWVPLTRLHVRLARLVDVGEKLGTEQLWGGLHRLERHVTAEYLAAIVSRHSDRGNLAGPLVEIQVG